MPSPKAVTSWTATVILLTGEFSASQKACAGLILVPAALGWGAVLFLTWALPPHKTTSRKKMLWAGIASVWRTLREALAFGIAAVYSAAVAIAVNSYLGHHSTASTRAASRTILDAMLAPTKCVAIALAILKPAWLRLALCRPTSQARHDAAEITARILYVLPARLLRGRMVLAQTISGNSRTISTSQKPRFPQVGSTLAHLINRYTTPRMVGLRCLMTLFALLFWTTHVPAGASAAG